MLLDVRICRADAVDLEISGKTAVVHDILRLGSKISVEVKLKVNVVRRGNASSLT